MKENSVVRKTLQLKMTRLCQHVEVWPKILRGHLSPVMDRESS